VEKGQQIGRVEATHTSRVFSTLPLLLCVWL